MRKQLLLLILMLLSVLASADNNSLCGEGVVRRSSSGTEQFDHNGLIYEVSDERAIVIGRVADYHDVVIPETITYKEKVYNVMVEQGSNSSNVRKGAFCEDDGIYSYTDPYLTGTAYSSNGGLCYHATNLKKVSCPSLTFIEGGWVTATYHTAFAECSSLQEIDMPNLTRIGDIAFVGCSSLETIDFPKLMFIEDQAFRGTNIKTATLPELKTINTTAFSNCCFLSSISLEKVEDLGTMKHSSTSCVGGVFLKCTSLKEVSLPNIVMINSSTDNRWVTVYGNFEGCTSLKKVELGSKCEVVDGRTFKGCSSLEDIYSYAITPPKLEWTAFDEETYNTAILYVHAIAYDTYKSTYPWNQFKNIKTIEPLYKLTYVVDGEVYKVYELAEGMNIQAEPAPEKEGYSFSGWSQVPSTMPAQDVTITGSFSINSYRLVYMVDGSEYKTETYVYGSAITPVVAPVKEGFTFSHWENVPAIMPAHDVITTAVYNVNCYAITYVIDNIAIIIQSLAYGSNIIPPEAPIKEGNTFSYWDNLPETMPAHDVTSTGIYTPNKYIITYIVDGEILMSEEVEYGSVITPPVSQREGYIISWNSHPTKMPAYDITIYGSYTTGIERLTIGNNNQKVFSLHGMRLRKPVTGLNVIQMSDGTIKKAVKR